jgi:hypothetical protein
VGFSGRRRDFAFENYEMMTRGGLARQASSKNRLVDAEHIYLRRIIRFHVKVKTIQRIESDLYMQRFTWQRGQPGTVHSLFLL